MHNSTTYETLNWVKLKKFFELILNNGHIEWHAIKTFPNLTHFLYLSFEFKKDRGIPLVGLNTQPHTLEVKARRNKANIMFNVPCKSKKQCVAPRVRDFGMTTLDYAKLENA